MKNKDLPNEIFKKEKSKVYSNYSHLTPNKTNNHYKTHHENEMNSICAWDVEQKSEVDSLMDYKL